MSMAEVRVGIATVGVVVSSMAQRYPTSDMPIHTAASRPPGASLLPHVAVGGASARLS